MNSPSIEHKEIRRFGIIAFIIFTLLSIYALRRSHAVPACLFVGLGAIGLLCAFLPGVMTPVYRVWNRIGHAVGRGVTLAVLTFVYYFLLVPYAFILRIFGTDLMKQKGDPDTYWLERDKPEQERDLYERPY